MTDHTPVDPRAHRVLADVSRVAVLETLRRAGRPLAVPDIAAAVGLHPNTVRAHLTQLAEHGHVRVRVEERTRPGRPRLLYEAAGGGEQRNYRLLAEALISYLAGAHDIAAARAAGRAYGRRLAATGHDGRRPINALVALLDEIGFAPELAEDTAGAGPDDGGHARIHLRRCPFRELAESDPEIVCGVHLGLMQGALRELGAPLSATRLEPFVTPDLCVATLGPAGSGPGSEGR